MRTKIVNLRHPDEFKLYIKAWCKKASKASDADMDKLDEELQKNNIGRWYTDQAFSDHDIRDMRDFFFTDGVCKTIQSYTWDDMFFVYKS